MDHLSQEDIFLFCDNETAPDRAANASEHITECEVCRAALSEAKELADMLNLVAKHEFVGERGTECIDEMQIAGYIDGKV